MLTDDEKARVRFHLGFMNTSGATSYQLGIVRQEQTLFLVELAMNILLPQGETLLRECLGICDQTKAKMVMGQDYLVADRVDEVTIRSDHLEVLWKEYKRWVGELATVLGVPTYPWADRQNAVVAGSIPRMH